MKSKEIKRLALAALLCALSAAVCLIGNVLNIADLTCCSVAAAVLYLARCELSGKYPWLIYAVTTALLLMLFPSASATVFYAAFFGYYPLIKDYIERLPKIFIYIVKFFLFNGVLVVLFRVMSYLFIAPGEVMSAEIILLALVLANVFFIVFDFALTFLGLAYRNHYRHLWGIDKMMD